MVVILVGTVETVRGEMTLGAFLAFITYNEALAWPVRSLGRVLSDMSKAGVSLDRVGYILQAQEEQDAPEAVEAATDGDITFEHVSFGYEGLAVLQDVSLPFRRAAPLPFWAVPAPAKAPWSISWTGFTTCRRDRAASPSAA